MKHYQIQQPEIVEDHFATLARIPDGTGVFLPELHRSRLTLDMTTLYGEEMSKKTSNTGDAQQKRGTKGS